MKFSAFVGEDREILTESLNTPQEFYITDDTKMPEAIYGSFTVGDTPYAMALVETNTQGVYLLEVGVKISKNVGWWKFKKGSDIPKVLSTTIEFAQSTIPFLGARLKGIAIRFRESAAEKRGKASKIVERIVKRSYIKTFTFYETEMPEQTKKQFAHYMFIGRKGVPASTVFKAKAFKNYDFDGTKSSPIPQDALAQVENKKPIKKTVTDKASTKYKWKSKFDVDTSNEEILNAVIDAKPVNVETAPDNKSEQPNTAQKINNYQKNIESLLDVDGPSDINDVYQMIGILINELNVFHSMRNKIKEHGFDPNKWDQTSFSIRMQTATKPEKKLIRSTGMFKENWDFYTGFQGLFFDALKVYAEKHKSLSWLSGEGTSSKIPNAMDISTYMDSHTIDVGDETFTEIKGVENGGVVMTVFNKEMIKYQSEVSPSDLKASILPSGGVNGGDLSFNPNTGLWSKENYNGLEVKMILNNDFGYGDHLKGKNGMTSAKKYTTSSYSTFNYYLRDSINKYLGDKADQISDSNLSNIMASNSHIQKITGLFGKTKPLEGSMWVFRQFGYVNQDVDDSLQVGQEYVDPGILSTSCKPEINFSGRYRLRLFIPEGSNVLPILDHSEHKNELEVILPPCSVIKIIERIDAKDGSYTFLTGVFVGSVWKSMQKEIKKTLTIKESKTILSVKEMIEMLENKEDKMKYDPAQKFSGPASTSSKAIMALVKSGKLKIDGPKPSKKKKK